MASRLGTSILQMVPFVVCSRTDTVSPYSRSSVQIVKQRENVLMLPSAGH